MLSTAQHLWEEGYMRGAKGASAAIKRGHVDKQLQGQGTGHVAIQKIPLKQPEPLRDCGYSQPVLVSLGVHSHRAEKETQVPGGKLKTSELGLRDFSLLCLF